MLHIHFYTKDHCPLCDDALSILALFKEEYPFTLEKRDITTNDEWLKQYQYTIPVIEIDDKQLYANKLNYDSLKSFLKESINNQQ